MLIITIEKKIIVMKVRVMKVKLLKNLMQYYKRYKI